MILWLGFTVWKLVCWWPTLWSLLDGVQHWVLAQYYTHIKHTHLSFHKPSVGNTSSVLSQHRPSQICTPESQLPAVPQRKPSHWTPSVVPDRASFLDLCTQVPASHWSHNVSLPVGLLSVTLDLCPSPSFPLSHNVSLPVGLFHGRGRCHRSCPLVSSHNTWAHKAHALTSENPAPKLPQQWSSLDSLTLVPGACQHYIGLGKPHQMAASTNHKLGGCVVQPRLYLIDIVQKNHRGVPGL